MANLKKRFFMANLMDEGYEPHQAAWAAGCHPREAEHIRAQLDAVLQSDEVPQNTGIDAAGLILLQTVREGELRGRGYTDEELSRRLDATDEELQLPPDRWTGKGSRMVKHLGLIADGLVGETDTEEGRTQREVARMIRIIICQRRTLRIRTPGQTLLAMLSLDPDEEQESWDNPRRWPWPGSIYIEDDLPGFTASDMPSLALNDEGSGSGSGLISPNVINSVLPPPRYNGEPMVPDTTLQGLLIGGNQEPRSITMLFSHSQGMEGPNFSLDIVQGKIMGATRTGQAPRDRNASAIIRIARFLEDTELAPEPVPASMRARVRRMGAWPGWMLCSDYDYVP